LALAILGLLADAVPALAQGVAPSPAAASASAPPGADRRLAGWLTRLQEASQRHNYTGTFVTSSNGGAMSSGRIWHACEGDRQFEKVESLTGAPRTTVRRSDEMVTLLPGQRLARLERRQGPGAFPDLPATGVAAVAEFYTFRPIGADRVAGFDTEVVQLQPRDAQRYGLRLWSEKKTGLLVKLQTLGLEGEVLEQTAFTELQLGAPLKPDRIVQAMTPPEGWRVERVDNVKTTAAAEGWVLRSPVAGFRSTGCWRRGATPGSVQWSFSDGLASVSLFIEPYDRQRHTQEGMMASGATVTLTRRLQDHWLTAMGEVPPQTLRAFAQGLERKR
jgi:sigma-E factor negative regulatory protein RseB